MVGALKCTTALVVVVGGWWYCGWWYRGTVVGGGGCAVVGCTHTVFCSLCRSIDAPVGILFCWTKRAAMVF